VARWPMRLTKVEREPTFVSSVPWSSPTGSLPSSLRSSCRRSASATTRSAPRAGWLPPSAPSQRLLGPTAPDHPARPSPRGAAQPRSRCLPEPSLGGGGGLGLRPVSVHDIEVTVPGKGARRRDRVTIHRTSVEPHADEIRMSRTQPSSVSATSPSGHRLPLRPRPPRDPPGPPPFPGRQPGTGIPGSGGVSPAARQRASPGASAGAAGRCGGSRNAAARKSK
jgi:hypothetical protein